MRLRQAKDYLMSQRGKRTLLAALLFACLTVIIYWGYIGGEAITGSDGMGPPADIEMMDVESSYFSSWRAFPAMGHLNFPSPTLSTIFLLGSQVLGLSAVTLTKLMVVLSFWLAGFAMYLCARHILKSDFAALAAGFVYVLNQVLLSQVTEAHHYFLLGCALFPLLFLFLYKALMDFDKRTAIGLPVMAFLFGTLAAPNLVLIAAIFLIIFILIYTLLAEGWSRPRRAYSLAVGALAVGLVLIFTVLSKYMAGGTPVLDTYYTIEQAHFASAYSIYHSLVLAASENTFIFGSDIGQWTIEGTIWPIGLVVAIGVPIIGFCALLGKERRHLVYSLLVPVIIFMVVAAGPNSPFGEVFTAMFKTVPLMDSIRAYSRFNLLTGFAMALLIGHVFTEREAIHQRISRFGGYTGRALTFVFSSRRALAGTLAFCLLFPSAAVLTGEVRSFDIPDSYMDPYEYIGSQSGDFRIVNLPFENVFYLTNMARYDGYPGTMTIDVGMYSPTFTGKPYAFGLETLDYWTFIGSTYTEQNYGYHYLSDLLGSTSSVRYFVGQIYTDPSELNDFASMNNVTVERLFDRNGTVLLNGEWLPRVHPVGALYLVSGDRAVMPQLMGLGVVDLTTDGIVLLGEVEDNRSIEELLGLADVIVVPNGDILQLVSELDPWGSGPAINVQDYGDKHTDDVNSNWVLTNSDFYAGYTGKPTLATNGNLSLTIPVGTETGQYDLLAKIVYRSNAGTLNMSLDGQQVLSIEPRSSSTYSGWVRVENLSLEAAQHSLTISNDGSGLTSIEQVVLAPHQAVEDKIDEALALLGTYHDKVVYTVSGAKSSQWVPYTYLSWLGEEGRGISDAVVYDATELAHNTTWVYDPDAARSIAFTMNGTGVDLLPVFTDLDPGRPYSLELSLKVASGEATGALATVEIWGRNKTTEATVLVDALTVYGNGGGGGYSNYVLNFTVPEGLTDIQFTISPGLAKTLMMDQMSLGISGAGYPQLNLDIPSDGSYVLEVAGVDRSGAPFLLIDGAMYLPVTSGNGTVGFVLDNMTEGRKAVTVGLSNIYGLTLTPAGLTEERSDAALAFERISNTEYRVQLTTDGPTWVLLSESYNPLWVAEMDGEELLHVNMNAMANAYYIPSAGNHTITLRFQGETIYHNLLILVLVAFVGSVAVMVVLQSDRLHVFAAGRGATMLNFSLRGLWKRKRGDDKGGGH